LVAERGANWLGWARHLRRDAHSTIVLAQNHSETDAEFAERVGRRIARLRTKGARVEQAAFVAGEDARPLHRPGLLRKLSALLGGAGGPARLYLDPSAGATGRARHLMGALAMTLSDLAMGSGLSISVGGSPCETPADCPAVA
jgi:hypothetical protein